MTPRPRIVLVIPVIDEEATIGDVVREVARDWVDDIVVVDGGSRDRTAAHATAAGARVVAEHRRGYGRACAAGVEAAVAAGAGIVVFMDGDGSDQPNHIGELIGPILAGDADFTIGSRVRGSRERGSMGAHQLLAGLLIGGIIGLLYGVRFTDMCALRAIRVETLQSLQMREMSYGWNLEMQMRAARVKLRIREIPVSHRCRAGGRSKVSGTLRGTLKATTRIMATMMRVALEPGSVRGTHGAGR